ncbi:hypothetical protein DFQ27_007754 [Actinomortierella ambigua]|uniref:Uncharacterized protein n=1 Tax=Actinomortierella ambigua TaxID=1343610 RepID=A0A9P6QGI7_9FUNG|nr:hypothetical protein DFQ27_007754 [Actinomortierella ambigua]
MPSDIVPAAVLRVSTEASHEQEHMLSEFHAKRSTPSPSLMSSKTAMGNSAVRVNEDSRPPSRWNTFGHQFSFLVTGIFSTIAVQWLYYQGAASSTSMLTVFLNYVGMMCVGLVLAVQTWLANWRRKQAIAADHANVEYNVLNSDANEMQEIGGGIISSRSLNKGGQEEDDDEDDVRLIKGHERSHHKSAHSGARRSPNTGTKHGHSSSSSFIGGDQGQHQRPSTDTVRELVMTEEERAMEDRQRKREARAAAWRLHWPIMAVALMDCVANALVTIGFFYVGSGLYQIIYSSIVIWCAILTRIFLSRRLRKLQWVAIFGVTIGLGISAIGKAQDASPDGVQQSWIERSFGSLITMGATFLYACVYVLSDKVMSTTAKAGENAPAPEKVCALAGTYATFFSGIYLCVHTIPQWHTEVTALVQSRGGVWSEILVMLPLVTLSSMIHSLNYYVLVKRVGSVATGLLQSLRAVLVFLMSHLMFCGADPGQCFNQAKGVSAVVVIGCVLLFSLSAKPAAAVVPSNTTTTKADAAAGEVVPPASPGGPTEIKLELRRSVDSEASENLQDAERLSLRRE